MNTLGKSIEKGKHSLLLQLCTNGMKNNNATEVKPYVAPHENVRETTLLSVLTGIVLLIFFGTANAYLGLKVGMTVSASIPAAVVSMAILRGILHRGTILENNIAQTIASTGEAVAAGVVFSIPAFYMLDYTPSLMLISLIALLGGIIGIVAMVIFRRYLIIDQHEELAYPEGTACAGILIAGEEGGVSAKKVFKGGLIGAGFRFVQSGFMLFPDTIETVIPVLPGGMIGMNVLPSLAGVGYLIGPRIAGIMFAGGLMAWLVAIPLIYFCGTFCPDAIFPAFEPVSQLGVWGVWEHYIQYIGAGVLTVGGIFEFIKALPVVVDSVKGIFKGVAGKVDGDLERTDRDMSFIAIAGLFALSIVAMAVIPEVPVGIGGALLVAFFGFLFVSISSRIVGVVGSSSNPVSGMVIATLFFTALIFKGCGVTGRAGIIHSIIVGSFVCVAAAVSADVSQDLKTGYLVGATPRDQQWMEILGAVVFAGMSGVVLNLLHNAYTIGSAELPAPATSVLAVLVKGIFEGNLPWTLLIVGVAIGIIVELMGAPALPFAIGFYLPVHLTVPIYIGGLVKLYCDRKRCDSNLGTLYASGLVAGDAIVGVLLALLTTAGVATKLAFADGVLSASIGNWVAIILISLVFVSLYTNSVNKNEA